MRQEAVNTFNKGLVKDLNPLNTPNNVVTDCMNGTFITFNGDEMLLQNDMGNIAITHNGEEIHLGDGFIPFGVKEYGGILYIVSARCSDTITYNNLTIELPAQFDITRDYVAGEYCKYSVNSNMYYFIRTDKVDTSHPVPTIVETEDPRWLVWATDSTEIKAPTCTHEFKIIETQVGSYPAPERLTVNGTPIETTTSFTTEDLKLNSSVQKLLQESTISAGDKMNFVMKNITGSLYPNLTSYSNTGVLQKKLFRLNIYQTLSNGSSLNISDTFTKKWKAGDMYFWFNEGSGIDQDQYIDSRFKGKLAAKLELEPIKLFEMSEAWLTYNSINNLYTSKISVKYETDCLIAIESCTLTLNNRTLPIVAYLIDGYFTFTPSIDNLVGVASLQYTITPTFNYILPQEYINQYTYSGSLSMEKSLMDVKFVNIDSLQENVNGTGYRTASIIYITDTNDSSINASYQRTDDKYAFVYYNPPIQTIALNAGYKMISYFTVDSSNFPKLVDGNGDDVFLDNVDLQTKFQNYLVRVVDLTCVPVSTTIYNFYKLSKLDDTNFNYPNCRAVPVNLKNSRGRYLTDSLYQSVNGVIPQYTNEYTLTPSTPNPATTPPNTLVFPSKYQISSPGNAYTYPWTANDLVTVEQGAAFNKFVVSSIKLKFGFAPGSGGNGYHMFLITESNGLFPTYSTETLIDARNAAFQLYYDTIWGNTSGVPMGSNGNMVATFYSFTPYVVSTILADGFYSFTDIKDVNNVTITPNSGERIAWVGWQNVNGGSTILSLTTNPYFNDGKYTWTSGFYVGEAQHFTSLTNYFSQTSFLERCLFAGSALLEDYLVNTRVYATPGAGELAGLIFKAHDYLTNPKIT